MFDHINVCSLLTLFVYFYLPTVSDNFFGKQASYMCTNCIAWSCSN